MAAGLAAAAENENNSKKRKSLDLDEKNKLRYYNLYMLLYINILYLLLCYNRLLSCIY